MLIRPFYAYFYAKIGLFLLIGARRPFYACQAFLCIPAHTLTFMLVRPFYAKQRTSCSKSCSSLWKKNEIDLSQNDGFLGDGLSGLSFCSRQKARCDLLDLPVLYYLRYHTHLVCHLLYHTCCWISSAMSHSVIFCILVQMLAIGISPCHAAHHTW